MEKKIKNNENATVQLPVLALRGLVLFPHMVLHFDVGREQSLHSLNMATATARYSLWHRSIKMRKIRLWTVCIK